MATRERLSQRGLRAYELGLLRRAVRITAYLLPLALLCVVEARARNVCACFGLLLMTTSIWLRWRSRAGAEDVTTGLIAGSGPLLIGLVVARAAPSWSGLFSVGTVLLVAGGLAAGAWVGAQQVRRGAAFARWAAATAIALLAASLGCVDFGPSGFGAVAAGVLLAEAGAALLARRLS